MERSVCGFGVRRAKPGPCSDCAVVTEGGLLEKPRCWVGWDDGEGGDKEIR